MKKSKKLEMGTSQEWMEPHVTKASYDKVYSTRDGESRK
jgi:hypothetical protein